MAKTETQPTPAAPAPAPKPDVNPQLAFEAAWDKNVNSMREVLTRTHQIRSGLKPSQIAKAESILKEFGV